MRTSSLILLSIEISLIGVVLLNLGNSGSSQGIKVLTILRVVKNRSIVGFVASMLLNTVESGVSLPSMAFMILSVVDSRLSIGAVLRIDVCLKAKPN